MPAQVTVDQIARIRASDLLDQEWYCRQYPDVEAVGVDAAEHYLLIGASLLRDPGPKFSTRHYLESYPDVARAQFNPLIHYLSFGCREGRACMPGAADSWTKAKRHTTEATLSRVTPSSALTLKRHQGLRSRMPGRPTVLVCAHLAGKHLYGGERSFLDVVGGFVDIGYNVVATIPEGGNQVYVDALRNQCIDVLEFRYGWWRSGEGVNESTIAAFAGIICEYGIDAVHANTIMLRESLVAARRMAIPAVVHVRELVMHDAAICDMIGLPADRIIQEVLENSDHLIANSRATGQQFQKAGTTHFLPNTVDLDEFHIPNDIDPIRINIAMVSSNIPKKGIFEFVQIARILSEEVPEARFILVGPDNEYTQALRLQQAAGLAPSSIVFAGYIEHPVLAMRQANIVVNLSHFQESFGRTVLEGMAASRVVVTYDWGALAELVVDGVSGFVVPFGAVAMAANRIRELCKDPERLRKMGMAGRNRALALYGKAHFAAGLKLAYDEILDRSVTREDSPPMLLPARTVSPSDHADGPLKIAYFLWHFPVPSETFVLNELRILVQDGHDVKVFCRRSPHPEFIPDFDIEFSSVDSPEMLARALVDSGRSIVHSHFTYPTVTEMVWPACELARIPFTFIAHAQDIFRFSNDELNKIGDIGRSKFCSRVIVPSRFHREYVAARGVPVDKILINPNGVDPDLYKNGWTRGRSQRSRRSLCAIHRFTEKKGLEQLIRAGKALETDGIDIHLYGYGDLEARYRELIAQQGSQNVHLHGPVDGRAAMLEVFRQHDLFACPSVRAVDGDMDGIPTVLMEAMASGLPVLATDVSGIPDLVRDEVTGFVCAATPESIVDAVRRFYARPAAQVEAIIDAAASLIRRDFHVGRLTAALVRLWQQRTIDVLIVSWNNLPQLREVIRRLYAFTTAPFHLVICDNGSEPDVTAYLCELYAARGNVTVILNRRNAMVGPGTNICLGNSWSKYAFYVCGKEGFVLDFGWERRIVDYLDANPDVGLAGTPCHSPSYLFGRQYPGAIALFPKFRNQSFATDNPQRKFAHVQGGFFAVRRAMIDSIGGFSDEVPHNYTDVEFSYYVESKGWKLGSAPGLLSLYNKTRPGIFTRVDESVAAIHPPTVPDLAVLDDISRRVGRYCNVCGWQGDEFVLVADMPLCGACRSSPADRSVYRCLAESTLTYRRLPAIGVGVGEPLASFWQQQFEGERCSFADWMSQLMAQGSMERAGSGCKLLYIDLSPATDFECHLVLQEVDRLLADEGTVILRSASTHEDALDRTELMRLAASSRGLQLVQEIVYSSSVTRYDWNPILVFQRIL